MNWKVSLGRAPRIFAGNRPGARQGVTATTALPSSFRLGGGLIGPRREQSLSKAARGLAGLVICLRPAAQSISVSGVTPPCHGTRGSHQPSARRREIRVAYARPCAGSSTLRPIRATTVWEDVNGILSKR